MTEIQAASSTGRATHTPVGSDGLRKAAVGGAYWTFGARTFGQLLQFAATIVLARLLTPDDFGLYGMVAVITGFVTLLTDLGLAAAIVQVPNLEERHRSTAFWLNFITGIFFSGIAYAVAVPVADFYGQPKLRHLLPALGLSFLLSFGVVQLALLERTLRFRRLAIIETLGVVAGTAAGIAAAGAGAGVWALVVLPTVTTTVNSVVLFFAAGWYPRLIFERSALRELLRFGGYLTGFSTANYWSRNADNLLVGKVLGADALGFYGRAYSLMMLPLNQISYVFSRVLFPALSAIQHDHDRVRRTYLRAVSVVSLVGFPIVLWLLAAAPEVIKVAFGERWQPAVPVLRWLCLAALPQTIGSLVGVIYQSQGRTDLQFRWGLATSVATVGAFGIGLIWGISGVAAAYAIRTWLLAWPNVAFPGRLVNLRPADVARACAESLVVAGPLALSAWLVELLLRRSVDAPAVLCLELIIAICIGAITVRLLRPASYTELRELVGRGPSRGLDAAEAATVALDDVAYSVEEPLGDV